MIFIQASPSYVVVNENLYSHAPSSYLCDDLVPRCNSILCSSSSVYVLTRSPRITSSSQPDPYESCASLSVRSLLFLNETHHFHLLSYFFVFISIFVDMLVQGVKSFTGH